MPVSLLGLAVFVFILLLSVNDASSAETGVHHDLRVELIPAEQKLVAVDEIHIRAPRTTLLEFRLSDRVSDIEVEVNDSPRGYFFQNSILRIDLSEKEAVAATRITINYTAVFNDPVPVRPANTDNPGYGVRATISERGSFLLAGALWYPQLKNAKATYVLTVRAPRGIFAVTAGRSLGHRSETNQSISRWQVSDPVEGLTLSAAAYQLQEKVLGDISVATYFLAANQELAPAYLEAAARYISLYTELFGPYPFDKFAVVENFFPTGYGFPSYTLLGSSVIRLPFIIDTSLGHEIAHCWWGNGVNIDYSRGNWSEALTTYISDYFFKEQRSEAEARRYRRQMQRNYSILADPRNEFPIARFYSRYDPLSKTIGYDKGAMIFHMLRRMLGEEAFWGALRDVYRDMLFQEASWQDFQLAFEKRGKRSLQTFFNQWVNTKGAPTFLLRSVEAAKSGEGWTIHGQVVQKEPFFTFELEVGLLTGNHTTRHRIEVSGEVTPFMIESDARPQKLALDPDHHLLRRLFPSEIPPAVNALKASTSVLMVLSDNLSSDFLPAARMLSRSLGLKQYRVVPEADIQPEQLKHHDLILIGYPRNREFLQKLPPEAVVYSHQFRLNNRIYDSASDSFFGVFAHPYTDDRVAALFWLNSDLFAETVARKIPHYGKYSYLAFRKDRNQAKGTWPVHQSPLMHQWNPSGFEIGFKKGASPK